MVDNNRQGQAAGPKLNPGDEAAPGTPGTGEDIIDGRSCPNCGGAGKIIKGIGGA